MNQGSFLLQNIEHIPDVEVNSLFKDVTNLYVKATYGMSQIVDDQELMNKGTNQLTPVMTYWLVVL